VALAAAVWLARTGYGIGQGAWHALMDRAAPDAVLETVRRVAGDWPGVLGYHDLKTRTAGSRTFVALHIEVEGRLTLNEAHAIADGLEHALEAAVKGAEVIIHLDPVGEGSGRVAKGARA
jgi:ferrous-iron efflux pump FieF